MDELTKVNLGSCINWPLQWAKLNPNQNVPTIFTVSLLH